MGQISVEIVCLPGADLSGNQHHLSLDENEVFSTEQAIKFYLEHCETNKQQASYAADIETLGNVLRKLYDGIVACNDFYPSKQDFESSEDGISPDLDIAELKVIESDIIDGDRRWLPNELDIIDLTSPAADPEKKD